MPLSEEGRQVLALAREWRDAASADLWLPEGSVARFLKLWVATNALFEMQFPDAGGDRLQVLAFAAWDPVAAAHNANRDRDTYRHALVSLGTPGVWNFRKNEYQRLGVPFESVATLETVYQVRCNLFHGRKSPSNTRDAVLIGAASRIVVTLLDALFAAPESIWDSRPA